MKRIFQLVFLIIFVGPNLYSQETQTQNDTQNQNLDTKYNALKGGAETYGEFKVFRESKLDEFWSEVTNNMEMLESNIQEKENKIIDLQAEIDQLKSDFEANEVRFQQNEYAATHIEYLGIDFSKTTFKVSMSILVGGLSILLMVGYIQYRHNRNIAVQNSAECKKLEREYEELRKKSLEKQIQLNRELQTERNLIEELRHKSPVTKKISA